MHKAVKSRLFALDAGRALAALVVVWHHVCVFYGRSIEYLLADHGTMLRLLMWLSDKNATAVMFFFFISGWSIRLSVEKISEKASRPIWSTYFMHRARRILPVYILALLWSYMLAVWIGRAGPDMTATTLAGNLLFLQSSSAAPATWFPPFAGNGPLWSLSYEVWYYLSLPLVIWAIARLRIVHQFSDAAPIALSLVVGLLALALNRVAPAPFFLFAALWPVWFAGYAFAGTEPATRREYLVAGAIVALAVLLSLSRPFVPSDTFGSLATGLTVGGMVIGLVLISRWPLMKRLISAQATIRMFRPVVWLGGGSYTLYLFHYPVLMFASYKGLPLSMAFILIALVIGASPILEARLQAAVRRWRVANAT